MQKSLYLNFISILPSFLYSQSPLLLLLTFSDAIHRLYVLFLPSPSYFFPLSFFPLFLITSLLIISTLLSPICLPNLPLSFSMIWWEFTSHILAFLTQMHSFPLGLAFIVLVPYQYFCPSSRTISHLSKTKSLLDFKPKTSSPSISTPKLLKLTLNKKYRQIHQNHDRI